MTDPERPVAVETIAATSEPFSREAWSDETDAIRNALVDDVREQVRVAGWDLDKVTANMYLLDGEPGSNTVALKVEAVRG